MSVVVVVVVVIVGTVTVVDVVDAVAVVAVVRTMASAVDVVVEVAIDVVAVPVTVYCCRRSCTRCKAVNGPMQTHARSALKKFERCCRG